MSDVRLEIYLFFRGDCRAAMGFYKEVFGGDLTVQSYKEAAASMPEGGAGSQMPEDNIMHASLEGGDIKLMGSDTPKASEKMAKVSLSLGGSDEARLREIFGKLSAGGNVFMPLQKQFWGDIYGQVTDKYNIEWMVNITQPKTA